MPLKEQKDLGNKGTRHSVNIVNIQAYLDIHFWDLCSERNQGIFICFNANYPLTLFGPGCFDLL